MLVGKLGIRKWCFCLDQSGWVSILVGLFTGALVLGAMLIENGFKVAGRDTLSLQFQSPLVAKMQVEVLVLTITA